MKHFESYEESMYRMDKAIRKLEDEDYQGAMNCVSSGLREVRSTPIFDDKTVRAHFESIISYIKSEHKEDGKRQIRDLISEIEKFQSECVYEESQQNR